MNTVSGRTASLLALSIGLAACGGGSNVDTPVPVNIDYSTLQLAESREGALVPAEKAEQVLQPLRNGVRLATRNGPVFIAAATTDTLLRQTYSGTTVQVDGVDESDLVKYDGQYIYAVRPEAAPAALSIPIPGVTRNVLQISRTNAATAGVEMISEFTIEDEQVVSPQVYRVTSTVDGGEGPTQFLAAVSQFYFSLPTIGPFPVDFVPLPDKTTIHLLDVRDPRAVSQAWKLELDGWMKASRKIGDTLYVITSYRPRVSGLFIPADSVEKREANERRIRSAAADDLLPHYRVDGGSSLQLTTPGDCFVASDLTDRDAYGELTVITAIDLSERRIKDVSCLSTNINGIYVSRDSVYVAGQGLRSDRISGFTVLHKFGLGAGNITYRASGAVVGHVGWTNASYFMDEFEDNLRIVTTQSASGGTEIHQLSVLQETAAHRLQTLSLLPNTRNPAPLGKPGEQVRAVRFVGDRAYVVTARSTDPLYVIDLSDPVNPRIAGELEIPGFATYLQPVGPEQSELLLSIGHQTNAAGVRQGVKIELFDVKDIAHPQTLGAAIFGSAGSTSAAGDDPHALSFLQVASDPGRFRLALPVDVFDTPDPAAPDRFLWSYSGLHLLEISGIGGQSPRLDFHGQIKTAAASDGDYLRYVLPSRSVLHDDSVFVIRGSRITASLWGNVGE